MPYSSSEIDFLAAYVFQADTWYVFPATVIHGINAVYLRPGIKRNRYERYREAWQFMWPAPPESADQVHTAAAGA